MNNSEIIPRADLEHCRIPSSIPCPTTGQLRPFFADETVSAEREGWLPNWASVDEMHKGQILLKWFRQLQLAGDIEREARDTVAAQKRYEAEQQEKLNDELAKAEKEHRRFSESKAKREHGLQIVESQNRQGAQRREQELVDRTAESSARILSELTKFRAAYLALPENRRNEISLDVLKFSVKFLETI